MRVLPSFLVPSVLAASLILVAPCAMATPVFEQPPVPGGMSYEASVARSIELADDFTLADPAAISRITWWGAYYDDDQPERDSFQLRLYKDVAGAGDLLSALSTVAIRRGSSSLVDSSGYLVYEYTARLSEPVELDAGTYYLSIQHLEPISWLWLTGGGGDDSIWYRLGPSDEWINDRGGGDLAFSLESELRDVPEPDTLSLLLAIATVLFLVRRNGRQTT